MGCEPNSFAPKFFCSKGQIFFCSKGQIFCKIDRFVSHTQDVNFRIVRNPWNQRPKCWPGHEVRAPFFPPKVDRFVPRTSNINFRIVRQPVELSKDALHAGLVMRYEPPSFLLKLTNFYFPGARLQRQLHQFRRGYSRAWSCTEGARFPAVPGTSRRTRRGSKSPGSFRGRSLPWPGGGTRSIA